MEKVFARDWFSSPLSVAVVRTSQSPFPLSGNPFGLPAQRSRRLTESSPTGLSSNTRLAQLRQHVRQAPATLGATLSNIRT